MNQNERLNYLINYLLEDLHLDKDLFFYKLYIKKGCSDSINLFVHPF